MTREAKGTRKPHVVIIGTRGYPNYYGGFETAVRYIAPALADAGWRVTVYGRAGGSSLTRGAADGRVEVKETWGIDSKSLSTLSYGLSACLHAAVRRPQVALVMNVANGYWLPILRLAGVPAIVNVDGLEWLRDKWGRFAKLVFRGGAMIPARLAPKLIADARAIQQYWGDHYNRELVFIPYGAEERGPLEVPLGLHRARLRVVRCSFRRREHGQGAFQAAELIASECDVVIVGSSGHTSELDDRAQRLDGRPRQRPLARARCERRPPPCPVAELWGVLPRAQCWWHQPGSRSSDDAGGTDSCAGHDLQSRSVRRVRNRVRRTRRVFHRQAPRPRAPGR